MEHDMFPADNFKILFKTNRMFYNFIRLRIFYNLWYL